MDDYFEANRRNWDERAELHRTDTTGSYRIDKVLGGGSSLHAIEANELGSVAGRDLIHLQCHIGLDTISLANLGARATGLDFSAKSIEAARDFARRAGADVRFVQASVYDAPAALGASYDVAYVTWGAINWLPDLGRWAEIVAALLRPDGLLYLAEGHPGMNVLEHECGNLVVRYGWRTPADRPLVWDDAQTYTGDQRQLQNTRNYEWIHPISDVIGALISAGLRLEFFHEHEQIPWRAFPMMIETGEDLFELPEGFPQIPLSYSLKAVKAG